MVKGLWPCSARNRMRGATGFFLPISHCCLHGCSSIHSGTDDSSGTGREANMFHYTSSPQSLQALTPPAVLQQQELEREK
ncbi:unnamed protein product, partial [Bubo scandiacus]